MIRDPRTISYPVGLKKLEKNKNSIFPKNKLYFLKTLKALMGRLFFSLFTLSYATPEGRRVNSVKQSSSEAYLRRGHKKSRELCVCVGMYVDKNIRTLFERTRHRRRFRFSASCREFCAPEVLYFGFCEKSEAKRSELTLSKSFISIYVPTRGPSEVRIASI